MTCLNPLEIVNPKVDTTVAFYKGRFFRELLIDEYGDKAFIKVPCGHCEACIARKSNEWAARIYYEWIHSKSAMFFTLTYSDEFLTVNPIRFRYGGVIFSETFEVPVLSKRDVQKFIHKLRKKLGNGLRYFLGGEYGEQFGRPHYHFILFNYNPKLTNDDLESLVKKCWSYGNVQVGDTNIRRVMYVAKYIYSSSTFDSSYVENFVKPFILTSRRPGIGSQYINNDIIEYHNRTLDKSVVVDNNVHLPMPRYYKDKIFTDESKDIMFDIYINNPPDPPTEAEIRLFLKRFNEKKKNKTL